MQISRAEFIDWLKTKEPNGRFSYINNENCCIAQFLRDTGKTAIPWVGGWHFWLDGDPQKYDRAGAIASANGFGGYEIPSYLRGPLHRDSFGAVLDALEKQPELVDNSD